MRKTSENFLLLLLLTPLLFINIKSSHDWGDDFAQYIHQGKNIIEGISQNETGYIFNENNFIGPQAYPIGFPIILSPIIFFQKIDIQSFNYVISFFLLLTGYIGFLLCRLYASYLTSLFTTLIIVYNPFLLNFKTEILSDLPFSFFSLLCLYLFYKKENFLNSVLIGLILGFTIHIRSIGNVLLFVYLIHRFWLYRYEIKKYNYLAISISIYIVFFIILKFSFPYNNNYPILSHSENLWYNVNNHISYNCAMLLNFFTNFGDKNFLFIGIISSATLVSFTLLGLLNSLKNKLFTPIFIYLFVYLLVIFLFPFGDAGLRFLIPVLFLIFIYAIQGLRLGLHSITSKNWVVACVIFGFISYPYYSEIRNIYSQESNILDGPQTNEAKQVFSFIRKTLEKNVVIAFDKPRALSLYTNRLSVALTPNVNKEVSLNEIEKFKINHILIKKGLSDSNLIHLVQNYREMFVLLYDSGGFEIYTIKR